MAPATILLLTVVEDLDFKLISLLTAGFPLENFKMSSQQDNEPVGQMMFSPSICADLHNKLVQHAFQAGPSNIVVKRIHRNLFKLPTALTSRPNDPDSNIVDYLGESLTEFFTLIDGWEARRNDDYLTPFAYPPVLSKLWLFSEFDFDSEYEYAVMLYGDAINPDAGGLFFDVQSERACWVALLGMWPRGKSGTRWTSCYING